MEARPRRVTISGNEHSFATTKGFYFEKGKWRTSIKLTKEESEHLPAHFGRCKLGRVSLSVGNFSDERSAAVASAK